MSRLRYRVRQVLDSFWFVPAVGLLLAVVVAEALVLAESALPPAVIELVPAVGPDGSRGLLSAIATSMLAAAATTFSITIAVLTLTSSAYGPRLVRNLMADRGNQVVLALLVSTSLFAMLVVRHVRAGEDSEFVPHLAVNAAVLLAVLSIVALVYFIHHISASIQISRLASGVREQLIALLDELFPIEPPSSRAPLSQWRALDGPVEVLSSGDGYVTSISTYRAVRAAAEQGARLEITVRPGSFVCAGDRLGLVEGSADPQRLVALEHALIAAVALGDQRTPVQDAEHLVRQLVDVAARSLSPGVNDPVTALTAIDALAAAFVRTTGRSDPLPVLRDGDGSPRMLVATRTAESLVVDAVDLVRQYVRDQPVVAHRLLGLLERLLEREPSVERCTAYRAAAHRVVDSAIGDETHHTDAAALRARLRALDQEATS